MPQIVVYGFPTTLRRVTKDAYRRNRASSLGQGLTNAKPVRISFALLCIATRRRSGSAGYGTSSAPGSGGSSGALPARSVLKDAALCAFLASGWSLASRAGRRSASALNRLAHAGKLRLQSRQPFMYLKNGMG